MFSMDDQRREATAEEDRDIKKKKRDDQNKRRRNLVSACQSLSNIDVANSNPVQYKIAADNKRDLPADTSVDSFNDKVKYGPQFACVVCNGAFFLDGVAEVSQVKGLTDPVAWQHFVNADFVNMPLFVQLDTQWVCHQCKMLVNNGKMPAMAAKNNLQATWVDPCSTRLTEEELQVVAINQTLSQVDDLKEGVFGFDETVTKTLYYHLPDVSSVAKFADSTRPFDEVLALHTRAPGQLPEVRTDSTMAAIHNLLTYHPRYSGTDYNIT
jgi:hypothetical protein